MTLLGEVRELAVFADQIQGELALLAGVLDAVEGAEVDDDLVRDVTEILTWLSTRLYGRRAAPGRAARALAAMQASDA